MRKLKGGALKQFGRMKSMTKKVYKSEAEETRKRGRTLRMRWKDGVKNAIQAQGVRDRRERLN